jgi:hypothetical protein
MYGVKVRDWKRSQKRMNLPNAMTGNRAGKHDWHYVRRVIGNAGYHFRDLFLIRPTHMLEIKNVISILG